MIWGTRGGMRGGTRGVMRGGKFISVNNFSAQEHASSKNRHILHFRVMTVGGIKLQV